MERHTVEGVVEAARSIAFLAANPPDYVGCAEAMLYAKRHHDAAVAHERIAKECDDLLTKLATEEP